MKRAIPEGLAREHVLLALQSLDAGADHPFGRPTGYQLVHEGKQYPPKAVIGLAFRHQTGNMLAPDAFSGGESSGQANRVLRDLGFTVEAIRPTGNAFVISADELHRKAVEIEDEGYFDPSNLKDERERRMRAIVQRQGQPNFRSKLLTAYNGRCAMTAADAEAALEAAHITPYQGPDSNRASNGLLLRADMLVLFDLDLIGIEPDTLTISIDNRLRGSNYESLAGQKLLVPDDPRQQPSREALQARWAGFKRTCSGMDR